MVANRKDYWLKYWNYTWGWTLVYPAELLGLVIVVTIVLLSVGRILWSYTGDWILVAKG